MAERMLKFVNTPRRLPDKREPQERRHDFNEVFREFAAARAKEQASRCSQCGIPFCQIHCPVHHNIPDWLALTAQDRLEEAYEVAQAVNSFPEVCGRVCPQDRLCEGNCVIEHGFDSVTIGTVEKYIAETAWERGWVRPIRPRAELDQSVGIIGGGPGGLATAERLRARGYTVHVYDRYDRMGGLMIYGIPGFKLEKYVIDRRVRLLEDGGVVLHPEFEVGREASLDELRGRHDALLIATGVYKSRYITLPGSDLGHVHQALDYLTASNRKGMGDAVPDFDGGALNAAGRDVVVIGGGDTAMDCVRTAVRQGARSVRCLYRRDRENMPGSIREVTHAEEEGVEFIWQAAPEALLGDDVVRAVRAVRMRLGTADPSGRRTPEPVEGSQFEIGADLVIKALGFDPQDLPTLFDAPDLRVSRWGTIETDLATMMTSLDGVFAAGDIVRGASLVVWAIRDGRDAATNIDRYLRQARNAPSPPET